MFYSHDRQIVLFVTRLPTLGKKHSFAHLLYQIIKLKRHLLYHSIHSTRMDNVGEFIFKTFDDYCEAHAIDVKHIVSHVHT